MRYAASPVDVSQNGEGLTGPWAWRTPGLPTLTDEDAQMGATHPLLANEDVAESVPTGRFHATA